MRASMRILAAALAVSILNCSVLPAWGGQDEPRGKPARAETEEAYAAREAASPELLEFTGGAHGIVIGILVIAAIVVLVIYVFDIFHHCGPGCHGHSP